MRSDTLNLQKLFEMQKALDKHIEQEHPRQEGEDRLAKKILALYSELGELLNVWRGFKYWSYDQEPRTEVKIPCLFCGGEGEGYFCGNEYTGQKEQCIHCHGTGVEKTQNRLLEEFADGLHFLLSIGIECNKSDVENWFVESNIKVFSSFDGIIEQFNDVFELINDFRYAFKCLNDYEEEYENLLYSYLGLGEMLGFTWEQIEEAYMKKNAENHKRQESGY
jgi:dimeric dUTPase (all-alpha-NTP-PPase superfamily)